MRTALLVLMLALPAWAVDPYPAAPTCSSHDNRTWHGLWNSTQGCHYDHHHGDNPHTLDGTFGTNLFTAMGGDGMGAPWQTFNATTGALENDAKHNGYIWTVRQNLSYTPAYGQPIVHFRGIVHQMADGHDATVRHHSASLEARVRNPNGSFGYASFGGWQDTGDLEVDDVKVIDVPGNGNRVKQHRSTDGMEVWYPSSQVAENGGQGLFRLSLTSHDAWDVTTAADPAKFDDYVCYPAPRCRSNATFFRPHLVQIDVPAVFEPIVDPDGDHVANYTGYLNRWGTIVQGCTTTSLDCVPFTLSNVRTDISYIYENVDAGRDFDIYFTVNGRLQPSGWMQPTH